MMKNFMRQMIKQFLGLAMIVGGFLLIFGEIGANVFAQDLVEVFDGRETFPQFQKPIDEESKFFYNSIKNQEADIKADLKKHLSADCEISIYLNTVLEGSFTKPNSLQKAYFYYGSCQKISLSRVTHSIMITENEKIIFNRFHSTENLQKVKQLPDINKNGLSELVFISTFHFGSMMDYDETWLDIVEYKSGDSFNYLGRATTFSWYGLSAAKDDKGIPAYIPWSYKINVKPSTNPIFSRETYRDIKNEKTNQTQWVLTEKLEDFKLESKKEN